MENKQQQVHPDQWLKDLPVSNEIEHFKSEQMITCDKCQRKSPPTRLKCFYCGENLTISDEQAQFLKPSLRKLEDWEKGFNLICQLESETAETEKISKLVNLEIDEVSSFIAAKKMLPIARLETHTEAEVLAQRLNELGLITQIQSDEKLNAETLPKRLRGIDVYEKKAVFILFNADEVAHIPFSDIKLIVVGTYFERKIEALESMKKKEFKKMLDSTEISNDEMLIDIYTANQDLGYRIEAKGFDFSCLGNKKSLLAKDNMKTLLQMLKSIAPEAKFDNDYLRIRSDISKVWEVSQRSDSSGLQRVRMGKLSRTNTTTVNNLLQFTRYSRLQNRLL